MIQLIVEKFQATSLCELHIPQHGAIYITYVTSLKLVFKNAQNGLKHIFKENIWKITCAEKNYRPGETS